MNRPYQTFQPYLTYQPLPSVLIFQVDIWFAADTKALLNVESNEVHKLKAFIFDLFAKDMTVSTVDADADLLPNTNGASQ